MGGRALVVSWSLVVATTAFAQSTGTAEALFRDGKRLMAEGQFAEACRAFEGSERLEHNVSTLLNLANCREKEGKLASAWGLFLRVETQTRDTAQATLNATAKKRAAALEARLSYLTISVADSSRVPDLTITRDEETVDPAEWNTAIPIDSGDHVVSGKAPGHETWSTKITIGPSDKKSVEVPRFKVLAEHAPVPAAPLPVATVQAPVETEAPSSFTGRRKLALGVGAGGLAIGGAAIGLGVSARGLRDDALARCPDIGCSVDDAAAAQALNDRARDRALYANVGFVVAGAAVVGAVVLWVTGSPERPARVVLSPVVGEMTGVALGGAL